MHKADEKPVSFVGRSARAAVLLVALAGLAVLLPAGTWAAGPPPPVLLFDQLAWDYGTVDPGTTVSQTFVLTNGGSSGTGVLNVSLSPSSVFTKTADTCTAAGLGPRKTCSVTIQYAPATVGSTDSATLTASGRQGASVSVSLTGRSTPGVGHLTISPTAWDFGTQSAAKAFTVTNDGTAAAFISGEGASTNPFALALELDTCSTAILAPGQSCQAGAQAILPSGCGATYSGVFGVSYFTDADDPIGSQETVTATLAAAQPSCELHLSVAPGSWDFGTQSGSQTFTFANDGTAPAQLLFFSGVAIYFTFDLGRCGLVLQPGDTCQATAEVTVPQGCGESLSGVWLFAFWSPPSGTSIYDVRITITGAQAACSP